MSHKASVRYFLGANTPQGFYSLYNDFVQPEAGDFLWVIKGGPGCGKSTFMKKIGAAAENSGMTVEYILCSGDPESLDGIYIQECATAYVDGTSPHIMDCSLPGGGGLYLDLGAFYHPDPLLKRRQELARLFSAYKEQYARAYDLLRAAQGASPEKIPGLITTELTEQVQKRAESLARRIIPTGEGYREKRRFLSGISCIGRCCLWESVESQCPQVITLDNELGLADSFLQVIRAQCIQKKQSVVLCLCPMDPQKFEAVLLPETGVAFVSVSRRKPWQGSVWRHLRLDAMADPQSIRVLREEFKSSQHIQDELLDMAYCSLHRAKTLHDDLEAVYRPYVDFEGENELCRLHMDYLLGRME